MKKTKIKFLTILMALVLAFSLGACGGSDAPKDASSDESSGAPVEKTDDSASNEDNNADSNSESGNDSNDSNDSSDSSQNETAGGKAKELKTSETGKIEVLESGYSYEGEDGLTAGVILGNANSKKAFEYPGVRVTAYGDDGSVLGTTEGSCEMILPGEKAAFSVNIDTKGKKPKKVEVKADQGDEASDTEGAFKAKDVPVTNVTENVDKEYDEISFTGEVENKTNEDLSMPYLITILRNKGKIVYAYEEMLDDIPKGGKLPFDFSFYSKVKHDKYEFYMVK